MGNLAVRKNTIIPRGCAFSTNRLMPHVTPILLEKKLIIEISTPPLEVLPSLQRHAATIKAGGIETVEQFLEMDFVEVARLTGLKTKHVISLQNRVFNEFSTPSQSG